MARAKDATSFLKRYMSFERNTLCLFSKLATSFSKVCYVFLTYTDLYEKPGVTFNGELLIELSDSVILSGKSCWLICIVPEIVVTKENNGKLITEPVYIYFV